jgi:hypothetical protein
MLKLGRKLLPAVHPHLKMRSYMSASLPAPPATLDNTAAAMPSLSKMMLNDQLGCCEIAWHFGHLRGVWTAENGHCEVTSDGWIERLYEVIGGYRPGNPGTDQGCATQDVLAYMIRAKEAIGYVAVNAADPTELRTAVWLFGAVTLGACLPDDVIQNPLAEWRSTSGEPDPNNGHCFGCPGKYDGSTIGISTWGQVITASDEWVSKYCATHNQGECWAILGSNWVNQVTHKAPNGFDIVSLKSHLEALGT